MTAKLQTTAVPREAMPWWSIAEVAAAERTEAWEDTLASNYRQWEVPTRVEAGFKAQLRHRDIAGLRVVECLCDPCHGRRLEQHVSRDDAAYIGVQITKSGRECFRRGDQTQWVGPGDLVIWTSDQPTEFTVTERLHKVSLILPWNDLRDRLPRNGHFHGSVLDSRSGIGAVLYSHIDALARQLDMLESGDLCAVRRATCELLTAAMSGGIDPASTCGGCRTMCWTTCRMSACRRRASPRPTTSRRATCTCCLRRPARACRPTSASSAWSAAATP